jgi:multiple sugar transport system permease protein
MRRVIANTFRKVWFFGAVALFVVLSAFRFYWMLITSLKTNSDLYSVTNIPFWFNDPPTLAHFRIRCGRWF